MSSYTVIARLLQLITLIFPLSEIVLGVGKRSRRGSASSADRNSMRVLWIVILLSVTAAFVAQRMALGILPFPIGITRSIALVLLVGGMVIRWSAIVTLGRYFTVDIAIHKEHPVVQHGLYKYVRHPSYTGLLLMFLGLGFALNDWLSIALLMIPIVAAVLNRVVKEEAALRNSLGSAYVDYCARTRRFIPGLV